MALVVAGVCLGVVGVVTMFLTVVLLSRQRRFQWYEVAVATFAFAVCATVVFATFHANAWAMHYGAIADSILHPTLHPVTILELLAKQFLLGVPTGAGLGCFAVGVVEREAQGSEWHPVEIRRLAITEQRREAAVAALVRNAGDQKRLSAPPLGAVLEGDLADMQEGRYAMLPPEFAARGFQLAGKSGSGKTVTAERVVHLLASQGKRIVYVDCKGTDPGLPLRLAAACVAAKGPQIRVHLFPDEPLNGWLGTPAEVANRLIATQDTWEPYYASTLQTAVRAALGGPANVACGGPCRSSAEFLTRLDPAFLTRAYQGTDREVLVRNVTRDRQVLPGVSMRFAALFDAVRGGFDGTASYSDSDLIFLSVPFASKADATAVVRNLLADFTHYTSDPNRKSRIGDDVKLIVDEASALTHLGEQIIDLAERVRDVGGSVDVSNQSFEGSGDDDDQRRRMRSAMAGGTILHGCDDPEPFLQTVGTSRKVEQSWQLDQTTHSGMGSMRMGFRMKVPPDEVRQAAVGEAWILSGGKYLHIRVIPNSFRQHHARAAELLEESRQRGRDLRVAPAPTTSAEPPADEAWPASPSWLDELRNPDGDGHGDH